MLSVANPAVVMNGAAMGEPEPSDSSFDALTPEHAAPVEPVGEADPVAAEQDDSQSLQPDWAESDSIWNLADLSSANRSSFPTSSIDESVSPRFDRAAGHGRSDAIAEHSDSIDRRVPCSKCPRHFASATPYLRDPRSGKFGVGFNGGNVGSERLELADFVIA